MRRYAKTLYKVKRPKDKGKILTEYTKCKTPHFFIYAKDKTKNEVEKVNNSVVNRLEKIIPNPRFQFRSSGLGNFDYKMLMSRDEVILNQDIIDKYNELDLKSKQMINENKGWCDSFAIEYRNIRSELLKIHSDINYVVDNLIEYLYGHKNKDYKVTLWETFGDIIVGNLKMNVESKLGDKIQCEVCGERIEKVARNQKMCKECAKKMDRIKAKQRMKRKRSSIHEESVNP